MGERNENAIFGDVLGIKIILLSEMLAIQLTNSSL